MCSVKGRGSEQEKWLPLSAQIACIQSLNSYLSIVKTITYYRLVWATKVVLAAICLVFPALVLGYKSFNVSMYHVPVPT